MNEQTQCHGAGARPFRLRIRSLRFSRKLGALAGAALVVLATQGHADTRELLGAGDTLRVTVFQNPDLTTETRISEQGTILFPLIGEVALAGQTPTAAATRIATQLKQGDFMKNPQVSVAVVQVRSRQVSVHGLVARPGRYALDDSNSKLTDILALAGGIIPGGDDTVTVMGKRDGEIRKILVDVPKMYRSGDLSGNIEVQNGDTIFVPRAPVFYIYGEVLRAGAYRLEPNATVMNALSLGGGLTPRGTERGLKISRKMPDGELKTIDARPSDPLQPDDVVHVPESMF